MGVLGIPGNLPTTMPHYRHARHAFAFGQRSGQPCQRIGRWPARAPALPAAAGHHRSPAIALHLFTYHTIFVAPDYRLTSTCASTSPSSPDRAFVIVPNYHRPGRASLTLPGIGVPGQRQAGPTAVRLTSTFGRGSAFSI